MADVINLNKQRKAKARVQKEQTASENRVKFGRTKQEKELEKATAEKLLRHVEGHKREGDEQD